jgi:hypothetical protein
MRGGGRSEGDDERAQLLDAVLGLGDHVAALGRIRESLLDLGLGRVAIAAPETLHEQLLQLAREVERIRGALADELAWLENELGGSP